VEIDPYRQMESAFQTAATQLPMLVTSTRRFTSWIISLRSRPINHRHSWRRPVPEVQQCDRRYVTEIQVLPVVASGAYMFSTYPRGVSELRCSPWLALRRHTQERMRSGRATVKLE